MDGGTVGIGLLDRLQDPATSTIDAWPRSMIQKIIFSFHKKRKKKKNTVQDHSDDRLLIEHSRRYLANQQDMRIECPNCALAGKSLSGTVRRRVFASLTDRKKCADNENIIVTRKYFSPKRKKNMFFRD